MTSSRQQRTAQKIREFYKDYFSDYGQEEAKRKAEEYAQGYLEAQEIPISVRMTGIFSKTIERYVGGRWDLEAEE